jgi:hypothetical protein
MYFSLILHLNNISGYKHVMFCVIVVIKILLQLLGPYELSLVIDIITCTYQVQGFPSNETLFQ